MAHCKHTYGKAQKLKSVLVFDRVFAEGEKIDAKVLKKTAKDDNYELSIKDLEIQEEKEALKEYGSSSSGASIGDIIKVSVKEAIPKGKVKKGSVHNAVVVRVKKGIYRNDGSKVKFDNNAAVLTDDKGEPIGTRIFGPVTRELRLRGQMKIISLAPEVL